MTIPIVATLIRISWVTVEYLYVAPNKVVPAKDWDRNSAKLWDVAHAIEIFGMIMGFMGVLRIQLGTSLIMRVGLILLLAGVFLRWTAIHELGKFFTKIVLIKKDHELVRTSVYKYTRHPAYTGSLIAHFGLGLCFASWLSISLSVLPYIVAALYRMHVEEQALVDAFGDEYVVYANETKRLIPGIY